MKHLAAVVLLALAGKAIDEKSVTAVIEAGGAKADAEKVQKLVESVQGKDVLQLAKEGLTKVSAAAAPAPAKVEEKKETKKVEKKEEKPAEEEDAGGFGDLFG